MKKIVGCYAVKTESQVYLVITTKEGKLVFYIFPELFSNHKKISSRSMKMLIKTKYEWLRYDLNEMKKPVPLELVLEDPRFRVLNYYRLDFEF